MIPFLTPSYISLLYTFQQRILMQCEDNNMYALQFLVKFLFLAVPDKRSRILEVVVVRRILVWVLGIWSGEGMRKG